MILVDTHVVLWIAQVPDMLSEAARDAISGERRRDGIGISDKSLWELAMLVSRGQVRVKTSLREFLQEVERNFIVLPVTSAVAEASVQFSDAYPKDPADRIIGATARVHGVRLVTRDEKIRASGEVPVVW